jgi:hypothetical protein
MLPLKGYLGKAIAAVVYLPKGAEGRVPGTVSVSGHKHVRAAD